MNHFEWRLTEEAHRRARQSERADTIRANSRFRSTEAFLTELRWRIAAAKSNTTGRAGSDLGVSAGTPSGGQDTNA